MDWRKCIIFVADKKNNNNMKKNFEELTALELWTLRQEIVLNSYFIADYVNSFNFKAEDICVFFDGYVDFLFELSGSDDIKYTFDTFDNSENLWRWFNCYDDLSWVEFENED